MKKVKSHPDIIDSFKELLIYNKHIKKRKIKCLKNTDFLSELPFYEELNLIKKIRHLEDMQWFIELKKLRKKDPIKQLQTSKSNIKDFFSDLLNEPKGFKYQIMLKVILK